MTVESPRMKTSALAVAALAGLSSQYRRAAAYSVGPRSLATGRNSAFKRPFSTRRSRRPAPFFLFPPPGSGYAGPEEEKCVLPDSYKATMEFPGTMRPGREPENMPFHDLPIGDDDPDPVPWPHFQEIEWHHQWGSPHPHPIPMEEYIELEGRWATAEDEAEMRRDARRGVRERREAAEKEKTSHLVMDDADDEEDMDADVDLGLGGNIAAGAEKEKVVEEEEVEEEEEEENDGDFLLELGLDADDDDEEEEGDEAAPSLEDDDPTALLEAMQGLMQTDDADLNFEEETDEIDLSLDLGLDSAVADEGAAKEAPTVPLDNLNEEDELDNLNEFSFDADNEFEDGGFEFDFGEEFEGETEGDADTDADAPTEKEDDDTESW